MEKADLEALKKALAERIERDAFALMIGSVEPAKPTALRLSASGYLVSDEAEPHCNCRGVLHRSDCPHMCA